MIVVSLTQLPGWLQAITTWRAGFGAKMGLGFAFMWLLTFPLEWEWEEMVGKEDIDQHPWKFLSTLDFPGVQIWS